MPNLIRNAVRAVPRVPLRVFGRYKILIVRQ
jgi:hypothetical protein